MLDLPDPAVAHDFVGFGFTDNVPIKNLLLSVKN